MAIERAREYLAACGLLDRIMEFDESSATVELAAQRIGCAPAHIAKTLSFENGDRVILVVFAGDARINNQKFKARFHTKPKMLSAAVAEERIGHAVGGVCPFGVKEDFDIYLDESLKRFETIYPAAGNAASAVRMTPEELEGVLPTAEWVDVSRL